MRLPTLLVHSGGEPDYKTGAVNVPVYQTSTFRQVKIGRPRGYEYSRTGNPTRSALEAALAASEGAAHALAFSSGSAAASAVLNLAGRKGRILACDELYGGTRRLIEQVFGRWGVSFHFCELSSPAKIKRAFEFRPNLVWIETPTNPLLKIIDIRAIGAASRRAGAVFAVDNTFASPFFQRPLSLGADIAVHSTTKYISGHSDVIGGAVMTSDDKIRDGLKFYQNAAGAVPGQWDSWLVLRGLKTLALRMSRHAENAGLLARFLRSHPKINKVYYPGLPGHANYETAVRQMSGFGGMVSAELSGFAAAEKFAGGLKLFALAESLGGVESLVAHPARMTHACVPERDRLKSGITDGVMRFSVGIEDPRDLIEDVAAALSAV